MKNKRENQKRPRELEDEQEHSGDELNVKIATWGPNQATLDSAVHEAMEHSSIQGLLKGTRHRLLSIELVDTEAKVKASHNRPRHQSVTSPQSTTILIIGRS